MNTPFRLLPLFILAIATLHAADKAPDPGPRGPGDPARLVLLSPAEPDRVLSAVAKADDERVAAMKAADRARLEAIFSDQLRYAHASGHIDTKASYTESLVTHRTVYETYDYRERNFVSAAPGIVLMTGRLLVRVRSSDGPNDLDLNFLGVWREEHGQWRFLAWQSCKNPPPAASAPAK